MTETPSPSQEATALARGGQWDTLEDLAPLIDAALRKARDDEREQCAKLCEGKQEYHKRKAQRLQFEEDIRPTKYMATACEECARDIRARGKETNDAQP